jgi:hypothetical protein
MKILSVFFSAFLFVTLNACQSDQRNNHEDDKNGGNTGQETPAKIIEGIVGDWELDPSAGGQQNSEIQKIRFTSEARYIMYKGDQKIDSGAYRMNEQLNNMYLESESNEKPREYDINLDQDQLTLKPTRPGDASYTYRRRN